jgi:hypothetical protein
MKHFSRYLWIILLLAFLLPASQLPATTRGIHVVSKKGQALYLYKDYHALVIGVSDYEWWPKLPNAADDAKEVAARLKEMGFTVKLVLDPTSRQLRTALTEMVYKMGYENNRALLFYYAGHGETETMADRTKLGYIIPKDCPLLKKNPMGFSTHAISMKDIESISLRIRAKHVIMLFDSCFSGSLFALVRAVPDDITEKSALPVRQYITAGKEDEQVPDRSMFKRVFLLGLEGDADLTGDGYITGSELGMYLSDKVVNYTHRRQHPQYGKINNPDLDRGDFIFVPAAKKVEYMPSADAQEKERLRKEKERFEAERRLYEERDRKLAAELKRMKEEMARFSLLEKEKSEANQRRLEAERKLEEERKLFEAERRKLEKDKLKLAYAPKSQTAPRISLRREAKKIKDGYIEHFVKAHGFFERGMNPFGSFANFFVDNADGTITDDSTGLMWQKGGSSNTMQNSRASSYVRKLNQDRFAGYSDWRLPTIDELASLIAKRQNQGLHLDSMFENKQKRCWSGDKAQWGGDNYDSRWIANFSQGRITTAVWFRRGGQSEWRERYIKNTKNYVKAVRTVR